MRHPLQDAFNALHDEIVAAELGGERMVRGTRALAELLEDVRADRFELAGLPAEDVLFSWALMLPGDEGSLNVGWLALHADGDRWRWQLTVLGAVDRDEILSERSVATPADAVSVLQDEQTMRQLACSMATRWLSRWAAGERARTGAGV